MSWAAPGPAPWAGSVRALVTDIEGTTSSIAFVHEVLFPWARARLDGWLREHCGRPEVAAECLAVAAEAGLEADDLDGQITTLRRWIDEDRKIQPLKTLQGLMWADGYAAGEYRGHVYPDAAAALRRWHAAALPLYVYSSGSVAAQKLLFGHSEAGDLLDCFSGHFDTAVGGKKTGAAYEAIARSLGLAPAGLLFLSDVRAELDAASAAGWRTIWLVRPGNPDRPSDGGTPAHPVAADFDAVSRIAGLPEAA